jgi:aryl-alcohol dehydrogenase-like predicted oxidoreductase
MAALGLGVYQSTPEETAGAVQTAIAHAYRLIDTASAYLNERQVGEGRALSESRPNCGSATRAGPLAEHKRPVTVFGQLPACIFQTCGRHAL